MGGETGRMFPDDAAAKAEEKAKSTDFYANLTDDERAEEGLPPREAPKEAPKPAEERRPEPEGGDDEEAAEAADLLLDEIAGLREDIHSALGEPRSGGPVEEGDELLAAALEHEDPVIRGLAERLQDTQKRLAATEADSREERAQRQLAKDSADFDAVKENYAIEGKPMTDAQIEQVEDYILKNPEVGRRLSIEQLTRVVFPGAARVGSRPAATKGPGDSANVKGSPVATIVDEGSSGGVPEGTWKPRPNETVESAVEEAGRRL